MQTNLLVRKSVQECKEKILGHELLIIKYSVIYNMNKNKKISNLMHSS